MILLISPHPAPTGQRHGVIPRAIRVLYSLHKTSQAPVKLRPTDGILGDLFDAIWPWTDMGAAKGTRFIDDQYRLNFGNFKIDSEVKVGVVLWIATMTDRYGSNEDRLDGCYKVIARGPRHVWLQAAES